MTKKEDVAVGVLTAIVMTIVAPVFVLFGYVVGIALLIWSAFVSTKLWEWFVVTNFNVQQISLASMVGLITLVKLVTTNVPNQNDEFWYKMLHWTIGPAIALLTGWLTKTYFVGL